MLTPFSYLPEAAVSDLFEWGSFKDQLEYLKQRGIDEFTIKRLGLEILTETNLASVGIKWEGITRGILWRLKDINGQLTGKVGARVWYKQGFLPNDDKPKFLPPKGQVPGVYFSPLADWDNLEYGQKIYICESYLKADVVSLLGRHAIGISGCWGWSYEKQLNWDFQTIPWKQMGLVPIICFDSNVCESKPKLLQAAHKLRAEMDVRCRVDARIIFLPPRNPDDHWGVDDYYRAHGRDATLVVLDSEPVVLPNPLLEHLKIMNTEVCVIREGVRFVDIKTGQLMKREEFENVIYAARMAEDGEGKQVSVAKVWTKWDGRNEVQRLVYRPGEERIREGEWYNLWKGMGCQPVAANVDLFLSWVYEVFQTDTERMFFLNWWAWQLQNPGKKLTTALVVVGKSGIGKGWMAGIVDQIWGIDNISKTSLGKMESRFNADYASKQLLVVEESDDMSGKNGGVIYNHIKDIITNKHIRLERKGMDAIQIDNCLNVFLTGNRIEIFKPDAFDRRLAVLEAVDREGKICNSQEYWRERWEWTERGGGAAAIYGYLLARELDGFDPYGEAPHTGVKDDMIEMTHDPLDVWVEEKEFTMRGIKVDGRLATAKELMFVYLDGQKPLPEITKGEIMKMVKALKNARMRVANGGKKIKVNGVSERYYLLWGEDKSDNWAKEVSDREFWKRLVASGGPTVAKETAPGNPDTKW